MIRLGVVSFLNARPLVAGLAARGDVRIEYRVPSALPELLESGAVDVALVPIIDVIRSGGALGVVSDACIGCDGETMTVRVFSQTPPDRITHIAGDTHSHTSVALVRVLWREMYGREITVQPFEADAPAIAREASKPGEAVLLIGDKVVSPHRAGYAFEIDLGGAWRAHTGLPFVFAVWAAKRDLPAAMIAEMSDLLATARDRGVAAAGEIARSEGPGLGWPVELAERYLCRCLKFTLTAAMRSGAERYAELAGAAGLAPVGAKIDWPAARAALSAQKVT
ncbi:MAG: menaquinone biosynthesis protein [Phycisphaerae bacterium]|nr:menaquinone biosynthesis protein [Phycisphaerae bacterium]